MAYCPKCGTEMPDEAKFCMKCGGQISAERSKSGFPIAGGILVILAASFVFINGLYYLIYMTSSYWHFGIGGIILGIICIIGFALGMAGGISSLTRKNFVSAVIGASFVVAGGSVSLVVPFSILPGMVSFVLGVIGLIFIAISKKEFSNKT